MAAPEQELLVGITCYTTTTKGFSAILKQRFTDFQVHEIGADGTVARLTDTHYRSPAATQSTEPTDAVQSISPDGVPGVLSSEANDRANPGPSERPSLEQLLAQFEALDGQGQQEALSEFLRAVKAHEAAPREHERPDPLFLDANENKERRREMHNFFKQPEFASILTETVSEKRPEGAAACPRIRVTYHPAKRSRGGGRGDAWHSGRRAQDWPGGSNKFTSFVLYKENMETQAAINLLSRFLHVHWSAFGIAGSKDKRGATTQNMTLFKVHPARLAALNQKLRGVQTGNFGFSPQALHLGGLRGNVFDIVLRKTSGNPTEVAAAAEALKRNGFVNYFGLQRFGHQEAPTHEIGCLLLRGEWKAAVAMIMRRRGGEQDPAAEARRLFLEAGDVQAAKQLMPRHAVAETAILKALAARGAQDHVGALLQIPRNLRLMYLHAAQSLLWNLAASHRIGRHGSDDVIVGDLVLPSTDEPQPVQVGATEFAEGGEEADADADEPASQARLANVTVATEEDVTTGRYSIDDVVLPLPGSEVIYPKNDTAEVYLKEAAARGLSLSSCEHRVKEFAITSLPGDYRRLVHRPKDLEWQLLEHREQNQDLGFTDLDALKGKPRPDFPEVQAGSALPEGSLLALRLRFRLPPSCYATMLIRELLKETTASMQHRERTLADQSASANPAATAQPVIDQSAVSKPLEDELESDKPLSTKNPT